jgi:hypothetical protein
MDPEAKCGQEMGAKGKREREEKRVSLVYGNISLIKIPFINLFMNQ